MVRRLGFAFPSLVLLAACGSDPLSGDDAGDGGATGDAAGDTRVEAEAAPPPPLPKNIQHIVVIVQENHTFDAYFGHTCKATAGSNPTCNVGPNCCEGAPDKDPSDAGPGPVVLDDAENAGYDPNHKQACELSEMNGGKMDRYVTGAACSNPKNFAIVPDTVLTTYRDWSTQYAMADRYFQPIVGSTSSNDMYFAVAKYQFTDNDAKPETNGAGCTLPATKTKYTGVTTVADLLIAKGLTFGSYNQGYQAMLNATLCPAAPADCPAHIPTVPCDYDPSDNPFQYYAQFADNPLYMHDYDQLAKDIAASKLPNLVFVKGLQYHNEHPGYGTTLSAGEAFVQSTVETILGSAYASDTLVLLTWDEGGGFFDHVTPPADSKADGKPYGTRVPMLALGKFARRNFISHVPMEHSSIVRFVEWELLDATGQLSARDAEVNGIGSLLDPTTTRAPPD